MTIEDCSGLAFIAQAKRLEKRLNLYNKLIERCEDKAPKYRKHLKKERRALRKKYKRLTGKDAPKEVNDGLPR